MEKINPKNITWHLNVKRPVYLLDASLVLASDLKELAHFAKVSYSQVFVIVENGQGSYYAPKTEIDQQVEELVKNLKAAEKIISSLSKHRLQVEKAINKVIKDIANDNYSVIVFNELFTIYRCFPPLRVVTRVLGYKADLPGPFIQKASQARLDFKNSWIKIRNDLDEIWQRVADKFGVSPEVIKSLTYQEFLNYLERGSFGPATLRFKARNKKFVFYKTKVSEQVLTSKKAIKFIGDALSDENVGLVDIIKGQVACLGQAKGRVKIILDPKDFKTNEKFILVTSMTTPQFVPLLRNVKAIVTDEGGLTCHAAIISRELNIPCIIGTKIATQVLKDGDRVEVDAKQGIVRKVK